MARLPPTTAEQRIEFLRDTQALIVPGFLSERVVVGGVTLNIRSPYPSDYFILNQVVGESGTDKQWSVALISRMVWMVDGVLLLSAGPNSQVEVRKVLEVLPEAAFTKLFSVVLSLIRRTAKARESLLFFLFEEVSRDLWRGLGKQSPNLDRVTGIAGLENLGLNAAQKVWVAWNSAEDQRDRDEYDWMVAKQTIAPHAPKAVDKLTKQEKQQEETRKRDRLKKLDEWYYKLTGVLDEDGKIITREGESIDPYAGDQVSMAYTSEELADEMRRWVSGEMDWHDTVVKRYKDQIQQKMLQERMAREARLAEVAREIREREENLGVRTRNRLVGYTSDQINQMMKESGNNQGPPGARTISYAPSRKQAAFDKWVDGEIDSGALVVEDGKLVPRKEIPKPRTDDRSLQSKINSRLPRYDGGTD